jgi:hypothetical protein
MDIKWYYYLWPRRILALLSWTELPDGQYNTKFLLKNLAYFALGLLLGYIFIVSPISLLIVWIVVTVLNVTVGIEGKILSHEISEPSYALTVGLIDVISPICLGYSIAYF